MALPRRKPSKGRQKIKTERTEKEANRLSPFSKSKCGLLDAAGELAAFQGAHVGVLVFSPGGGCAYCLDSPSVGHVFGSFFPPLPLPGGEGAPAPDPAAAIFDPEAVAAATRQLKATKALVVAEKARMKAIEEKVEEAMAGRPFLWLADVEALGPAELPELIRALERHRHQMLAALQGKNERPSKRSRLSSS